MNSPEEPSPPDPGPLSDDQLERELREAMKASPDPKVQIRIEYEAERALRRIGRKPEDQGNSAA
ncbi:MAG: hypothetical protein ACOYPS_00875 [Phycisphaerales bacterium]